MAREEARLAGAGEEAQVLGVGARGDRQLGLGARSPAPRAWSARPAGTACARSTPATARRACRTGPWRDRRRRAAGRRRSPARSGRWPARARRARSASSSIASSRTWPLQRDARVRRLARGVAGQERLDDARPELRPQVQREVRQPHAGARPTARAAPRRPSSRTRRRRSRRRATAPASPRPRSRAAGARPRRSPRRRSSRRACARDPTGTDAPRAAAPSARCSASAARSAACSLPGESPPSSSAIAVVPTRAASKQVLALDQRHDRGAGGGQRAAAVGVEARGDHAVALDDAPRPGSGRRRASRRRRRHGPRNAERRAHWARRDALRIVRGPRPLESRTGGCSTQPVTPAASKRRSSARQPSKSLRRRAPSPRRRSSSLTALTDAFSSATVCVVDAPCSQCGLQARHLAGAGSSAIAARYWRSSLTSARSAALVGLLAADRRAATSASERSSKRAQICVDLRR